MRNKHKTSKIVVKSYVILSTCECLWTVASFLYNIFLKISWLQMLSSGLSFSLLCSWRNESPWLQVCAKNTWAHELFIKNFIRVPQFHRLELCKKFLRTYSRVQMQQCCRKAGEAVSIIIDCESHYLPSKLVIWDLLVPLPYRLDVQNMLRQSNKATFTKSCRKFGPENASMKLRTQLSLTDDSCLPWNGSTGRGCVHSSTDWRDVWQPQTAH